MYVATLNHVVCGTTLKYIGQYKERNIIQLYIYIYITTRVYILNTLEVKISFSKYNLFSKRAIGIIDRKTLHQTKEYPYLVSNYSKMFREPLVSFVSYRAPTKNVSV